MYKVNENKVCLSKSQDRCIRVVNSFNLDCILMLKTISDYNFYSACMRSIPLPPERQETLESNRHSDSINKSLVKINNHANFCSLQNFTINLCFIYLHNSDLSIIFFFKLVLFYKYVSSRFIKRMTTLLLHVEN